MDNLRKSLLFVYLITHSLLATASVEIDTVSVPFNYDDANSDVFDFTYAVYEPSEIPAGTIFYFGGGPGENSIENLLTDNMYFPKNFRVVTYDLRGFGRNEFPGQQLTLTNLSTDYAAKDILRVIERLELSDYIVYGHSYGTLIATVTASQLREAIQPKAVVLSGVLSRAFDFRSEEIVWGMQSQWTELFFSLPSEIRARFYSEPQRLGYTSKEWGKIVSSGLALGLINNLSLIKTLILQAFEENDPGVLSAFAGQSVLSESAEFAYQSIACQEITSIDNRIFYLENGFLSITDEERNWCDGFTLAPYDSRNFQVKAPIIYVQGTRDAYTPYYMTEHHNLSQHESAKKLTAKVLDAGHTPLRWNLSDCSESIWLAMYSADFAEVERSFATCQTPIAIISEQLL